MIMENKLELAQLKNYLGTGLKYISKFDETEEFYEFDDREGYHEAFKEGSIWEFVGFTEIEIPLGEGELSGELLQHEYGFYRGNYSSHKALMYRLSDLDKYMPELGFVPADVLFPANEYKNEFDRRSAIVALELQSAINCSCTYFAILQKLFEWHFWVFDQSYFEEGLIIDKLKQS